ncbi:hypothetical protein MUA26_07570 [Staphylococcus sp. IVB6246]|uniref:hypothetical protein n=1 Tax=Staphylococcus sp. IVB6246 TaxID=2989772 RepID=UPI0021D2BCFC|nr:hypothetical protein [Staphylococcus sp. IVB6246]UXR69000.1 hypothetical protein MUA26_07570 [Staphylococcus sp. IVB6246]
MNFNDFQNFYGELSNQAEKEFGGDSEFLKDRITTLKKDAPENVSYEIIYSIALYESLKAQQDMKILNTVKYLLDRD